MVRAFKVLLAALRTHTFKRRRKKGKKEKESLFFRLDVKACQGFLKKYYPRQEEWRFFTKTRRA
jgi:hypothetical protein